MESILPELIRIDLGHVNAFLWVGAGGPTLIDAGLPWTFAKLLQGMQAEHVQPADLQRIIITHADLDHIGGLKKLSQMTKAPVACHAAEAAFITGQKPLPTRRSLPGWLAGLGSHTLANIYKPFASGEVTLLLDKEKTPEGFLVVHLPGHSPGHIGLFHKEAGLLIIGDALLNRNHQLALPPTLFTPNVALAIESLGKLARLKFGIACFGHGPCITSGADAKLRTFVAGLATP